MAWARRSRGATATTARALLAGVAALALALLPTRVTVRESALFAGVQPRALAHLLADFSHHPRLDPQLGEWTVLEESGGGSAWRYSVSYSCGRRCRGRASVAALAGDGGDAGDGAVAGPHGQQQQRVLVAHRACAPLLPLLPWPDLCDEWETETVVSAGAEGDGDGDGDGDGARLVETTSTTCAWARAVAGACADELRRERRRRLQRLRDLLRERQHAT